MQGVSGSVVSGPYLASPACPAQPPQHRAAPPPAFLSSPSRPAGSPLLRLRHSRSSSGAPSPASAAKDNGAPVGEYGEIVVVPAGADEEEEIKLDCDESGCVLVVSKSKSQRLSLEQEQGDGVLQCNLSGCFYSPTAAATEFKVLEGAGWRLGYETVPDSEDSICAMVGAGGWSISLTASEFHDFCKLIQMLRKGIITMDQDGVLAREDIVMQVERGSLWMECVVPKKGLSNLQKFLQFGGGRAEKSAFEIRFILTGKMDKRQAEGYWPADAVMDMLRKIDELNGAAAAAAAAAPAEADKVATPA